MNTRRRIAALSVSALCAATAVVGVGSPQTASAETTGGYPVVWSVGDLCDDTGACERVGNLIAADNSTDGVALAGDLAYDNGSRADFDRFNRLFSSKRFANGSTIKSKSYSAPGNHEYRDLTQPCPYYFNYYGSTKAGNCETVSWKSRILPAGSTTSTPGAWRVITLNTNYASEPVSGACNTWCRAGDSSTKYAWGLTPTQAAAQRKFLANQCRAADANDQGAMVTFHHPALADSNYAPGTELGRDLYGVATANGCEIVTVGHDHLYERFTSRNASGGFDADGATQFLVGTGGRDPDAPGVNNSVDHYVGLGALRLVLKPTGADFEFISVDGVVRDSGTVPLN